MASEPASEPTPGLLVNSSVRLVRPLGAGGMGSVWVADHLALNTQVVVKFIATELSRNADAVSRFKREAAAASQVKSPHVVQMLDHGVTENALPFIVMELLEGHDLAAHLEAHGRMRPEEVAAIVSQLARALGKAHESGIVHRDIKPQNVFLCDAGGGELFVKLLDFGIAKSTVVDKLDSGTKTGSMMGSPYYMSPEQVVGSKDIDHRTDLWAVGVVAYEALTGLRPFNAETVGGLALQIHNAPLPTPSETNGLLPKSVDAWFFRACARAPDQRFQSAKELADALGAAIHGTAPTAISLAPSSGPAADSIELARTALSASPVSVQSAPDPKTRTDAGLDLSPTLPPARGNRTMVYGLGGAVALGLVLAGVALYKSTVTTETASGTGGAGGIAIDLLRAHGSASASASVGLFPPPPSATSEATAPSASASHATALPLPTGHATTKPSGSVGIPSASASASVKVVPPKPTGGNEDDIK